MGIKMSVIVALPGLRASVWRCVLSKISASIILLIIAPIVNQCFDANHMSFLIHSDSSPCSFVIEQCFASGQSLSFLVGLKLPSR